MNSPRLRHNLVPPAALPLVVKRDIMSDQLKIDITLIGAAILAAASVLGADLDLPAWLHILGRLI